MSRRLTSSMLILGLSLAGCASKAGTGALIGAGGGALVGGVIGNQSKGRGTEGALIGAAAGGIGGALIGNEMDRKDDKAAREAERRPPRRADDRYGREERITQEQVITWTARGTRDDIIIDRIQQSGTVFELTARDENRLRDEGVGEDVIRAMKNTSRTSGY